MLAVQDSLMPKLLKNGSFPDQEYSKVVECCLKQVDMVIIRLRGMEQADAAVLTLVLRILDVRSMELRSV